MKRILMALALMTAVAGCNSSTGDDDGGGPGASTYFPLTTGESWTYAYSDSTGLTPDKTKTVTGAMTYLGKTYQSLAATSPYSEYVDSTLFRTEGNIVYSLASHHPVKPVLKAAATSWYDSTELPYYKFGIREGASWTVMDHLETHGEFQTGKYIGLETVTTPAGTFANCAKFSFTTIWPYATKPGTDSVVPWGEVQTEWLAPNVGLVKRVFWGGELTNDADTENGTTIVLTAHTAGTQ